MKKKAIKGTPATVVAAPLKKKSTKVETSTEAILPKKKKKKTTVAQAEPEVAVKTKTKKGKLDEANALSVTKKAITEKKDLKYIYPTEADDIPKRKKFRAEVRRKVRAMEKDLFKLQASKNKEDQELYLKKQDIFDEYCAGVYSFA